MKTNQILSAACFALIITGPACSAKFVDIGKDDAGIGAGATSSVGGANGVSCTYEGKSYPAGVNFKSSDGCNTCSCTADGLVGCTVMACQAGGASGVGGGTAISGCFYDGVPHPSGSIFKATDGCNTCSCNKDGSVTCTEMGCIGVGGASGVGGAGSVGCYYDGKTYPLSSSFKSSDGCNTCTCAKSGSVICTEMACGAGGSNGVGGSTGTIGQCVYNGVIYSAGEIIKATDGCNTCSCTASGAVCTTKACGTGGTGAGGSSGVGGSTGTTGQCVYNGVTYSVGQVIKSDGCNTCSCYSFGYGCTAMACNVGGASAAGGASGVTCSYGGMNYPVGSTFNATDGCNTCSCTSGGLAVCTKMACGAGGSTSVNCPAIPTIMPDCGTAKPTMAYDGNGCPKGYVCPVCLAPKAQVPTCSPGVTLTVSYDANGCVNGYVCPSCPNVKLTMPQCDDGVQAVAKTDAAGCVIGYECPNCPALSYVPLDCGSDKPVGMYAGQSGCLIGYKCPGPCNTSPVYCEIAPPRCPAFQVPELDEKGFCYTTRCIPIEGCTCSAASDCPDKSQYTCNMTTNHCTPYL